MRWQEQTETPSLPPASGVLERLGLTDALRLVRLGNALPRIVIAADCFAAMREHLAKARDELGGLLVGQAYGGLNQAEGAQLIAVQQAVDSRTYDSTGVSLRMETEVWERARALAPAQVIGWYHSHPDLGAFFSDTDRTTQRNFFRQAHSVGLVIDPIRDELKVYLGPDCTPVPAENVMIGVSPQV